MKHLFLAICSVMLLINSNLLAENTSPIIYKIDIHQEINPTTRLFLSKGMQEAQSLQAQAIIIDMNTYGGTVVDADSMRSAILYSPIPVYTFINNNAISAGALIAIASEKIFMVKGAVIGAATAIIQTGEAAPDKFQSSVRGIIKTTAEFHGKDTIITQQDTVFKWKRDPIYAEAMVDESVHIPLVSDSGKVITFTTEEAVKYGYCDGIASSVEDIIENHLKMGEYQIVSYKPSLFIKTKGFFMNPALQAVLIMLIVAGIYFELQSPGLGFAGAVALAASILYFTPLWMEGVAQHWEIILFVIGIVLIAIEIFAIPGFGVAGISGIILAVSGLVLALLNNNNFDFQPVDLTDASRALLTVMCGIILSFAAMLYLSSRIGEKGLFRKIALQTDIDSTIITSEEKLSLQGKTGVTLTVLRPSGKVVIDGDLYDAISESGLFIAENTPVKVVKHEAAQIYVNESST